MIHERSLCSSNEPQKELMWALLSVSGSGQSAVERTRYKCRQGRSQGRGKKGAGNRKLLLRRKIGSQEIQEEAPRGDRALAWSSPLKESL